MFLLSRFLLSSLILPLSSKSLKENLIGFHTSSSFQTRAGFLPSDILLFIILLRMNDFMQKKFNQFNYFAGNFYSAKRKCLYVLEWQTFTCCNPGQSFYRKLFLFVSKYIQHNISFRIHQPYYDIFSIIPNHQTRQQPFQSSFQNIHLCMHS